jgi:Viral BACON domain
MRFIETENLSANIRSASRSPFSYLICLLFVVSSVWVAFTPTEARGLNHSKQKLLFESQTRRSIKTLRRIQRKPARRSATTRIALSRNRLGKELKPFDSPGEAQEFYRFKRAPGRKGPMPVERYLKALDHIKQMPVYSTRLNRFLPQDKAGAPSPEDSALGAWSQLGPGNIGGRTRALIINPANANIMYAAGVAGGVWKTTDAGASWAPVGDLLANIAMNSLAMDPANPNVIYAGTGEGYFNGDSVRGAGIFKTTDGGASWAHLINTNSADFYFVNDIVISSTNGQRIYAATGTGVWRSTDGGTTWTQSLNPSVIGGCLDLAIRTDQATDYIFASCGTFTQATIYRNTDASGAGTWTPVLADSGMGRTSLAIAPSNQAVIYALASSIDAGPFNLGLHGVFRSTDGGINWAARVRNTNPTKLNTTLLSNPIVAFSSECSGKTSLFFNQGWYDNAIAIDPADSNRVWAGGIDLFRSDDGGANWGIASHWWADASLSVFSHADQHAIIFHPQYDGSSNKTMFVANDGGLFRTNDARAAVGIGANAVCNQISSVPWTNLNNNFGVTQFYHGAPYPGGATYFGGTQDNGVVRGTNAAGVSGWTMMLGGDGGHVAVDPTNTNILYAENTELSIQKSTDGGTNFAVATSGISENPNQFLFISPFIMDQSNSERLWTGGFFLWRTSNAAASWTRASALTTGNGSVSAIAAAPTNPNNVLAGMSDGFIHRTNVGLTSGGNTTWPFSQPRDGFVSSVYFDPANANLAYATYSTFNVLPTDRHVYKTTNAGATWTGIDGTGPSSIPDIPVHSVVVDPTNTARLYVGTDLGVFTSLDGGSSWAIENTGFANVVTESLAVDVAGGVISLFAFTHGRGAWRVQVCAYSISPVNKFSNMSGEPGALNVTAPAGCSWTAASNSSWIIITSDEGGSGNGTIDFEIRENFTGGARQGTISVAGRVFIIVQDGGLGEDCTYSISPLFQTVPPGGGAGSISVTSENRCAWQAVSSVSWITITSGNIGIGDGVVTYSIAANPGSIGRKGNIVIGGKTFVVKQKGN